MHLFIIGHAVWGHTFGRNRFNVKITLTQSLTQTHNTELFPDANSCFKCKKTFFTSLISQRGLARRDSTKWKSSVRENVPFAPDFSCYPVKFFLKKGKNN